MGNILRNQPRYNGKHVNVRNSDGSRGWYCAVYDSSYTDWPQDSFVDVMLPPHVMEKYIPCATLEQLAKELDIPFVNMKRSIDRYNELCDGGSDVDFGKPQQFMHAIKQPPFWAARKHIRVSSICSGIITNEHAQALDATGRIIPGLYCAGNVGGGFFGGGDYPFHHTGLSLGRCFTFGMIAALHVVSGTLSSANP